MAGKSDYLENKILEHVLKNTAYSSPATVYVGLYTAAPNDASTGSSGGTELSGNGYSRQSCAFGAASGGSISNSGTVTFGPNTTSDWGTVTHFAVFDASTNGNMLYWAALTASKTAAVGDSISFGAGALVVTED